MSFTAKFTFKGVSTRADHKDVVCGTLAGRRVICMQGRLHGYESYAPDEVAYPVYVLKELGVKALVVTNASGGINTGYHAGDFMLITDHINMTGKSPLTGKNDPELGTRFPDMTFAYSHELGEKAVQAAADCGLKLHQGVYCGVNGPQFETPAEIRMFRTLGADAVGMSTVFEVIAAAHCGLPLVGIAMITNMAAGVYAALSRRWGWQDCRAPRRIVCAEIWWQGCSRKFKENFKKVLTESDFCDILIKLSRKSVGRRFQGAQLGRALRSGTKEAAGSVCHLDHFFQIK